MYILFCQHFTGFFSVVQYTVPEFNVFFLGGGQTVPMCIIKGLFRAYCDPKESLSRQWKNIIDIILLTLHTRCRPIFTTVITNTTAGAEISTCGMEY